MPEKWQQTRDLCSQEDAMTGYLADYDEDDLQVV